MKKTISIAITLILIITSLSLPIDVYAASKPASTSISSVTAKPAGFTVKYKKISGVTGYLIQYSTSSKFSKKSTKSLNVAKASTTSKTVSKLKSKKKYYLRVRAYVTTNGKTAYSSWSDVKSVTTRHKNEANPTSVKTLTAKQAAFKVTWTKISNATGYQIQYSTSSKFTKNTTKSVKVKKASTVSKTVSKLSSNKKYYVRIRTYRIVNKKTYYSAWSKSKAVTTRHKNEANPTSVKTLTGKQAAFKLTWNKVDKATGYQIQYSTSSKFTKNTTKSVKVKKASIVSKTVSKLSSNKKYYVRIRTYRVVNKKTYYSAWSKAKAVTTIHKYSPNTPAINSLTSGYASFTVKWSDPSNWHEPSKWKSSYDQGFEIQYSTSSKFTSKTTKSAKYSYKELSSNNKKYSKLGSAAKYYVRIRAYNYIEKKYCYSKWSAVKSVTTKATADAEYKTLLNNAYKSMHLTNDMSDFAKSLVIGKWITSHVSYESYSGEVYYNNELKGTCYTAYGALKYGKAVCAGYSDLFKVFCDLADIPCYQLQGSNNGYSPHAWNALKIDGYWYSVEPQVYGGWINKYNKGLTENDFNDPDLLRIERLNYSGSQLGMITEETEGYMYSISKCDSNSKKIWNEKCTPHGTNKTFESLYPEYSNLRYELYCWEFK